MKMLCGIGTNLPGISGAEALRLNGIYRGDTYGIFFVYFETGASSSASWRSPTDAFSLAS